MYHYAGNNPIIYSDPDGEFAVPFLLVTAALGATAFASGTQISICGTIITQKERKVLMVLHSKKL